MANEVELNLKFNGGFMDEILRSSKF